MQADDSTSSEACKRKSIRESAFKRVDDTSTRLDGIKAMARLAAGVHDELRKMAGQGSLPYSQWVSTAFIVLKVRYDEDKCI